MVQRMQRQRAQDADPGAARSSNAVAAGDRLRDREICRMAAFRIRETANRIATLANSAQDENLRRALKVLNQRLMCEEHALLELPASTTS